MKCGDRWEQSAESLAVTTARRILTEADALDFSDTRAMAGAIGSLREALRMVLDERAPL